MPSPRSLLFGLMTAVGLLAPPGAASAQPWDRPPMPVISDTPEFCFELARRFAVLQRLAVSPSPDARLLAFEGRQMCEHGLIRPGIMRMRRAIMMLRAEG